MMYALPHPQELLNIVKSSQAQAATTMTTGGGVTLANMVPPKPPGVSSVLHGDVGVAPVPSIPSHAIPPMAVTAGVPPHIPGGVGMGGGTGGGAPPPPKMAQKPPNVNSAFTYGGWCVCVCVCMHVCVCIT